MSEIKIQHLVLAGIMLLAACGRNDTRQKSFLEQEGIRESCQKVFEENELMGMSVLYIYNGKTVWEGYFGLADFERQIPVSDRTMYRIASISKMFAATALLQLLGSGQSGPGYRRKPVPGMAIETPQT